MKAGPHSGDSLRDIVRMKLDEEQRTGKFYWGYSGSLCHPAKVQAFVAEARKERSPVHLVLSTTASRYNPPGFEEVRAFSTDRKKWHRLPSCINLWNCRYALVATELKGVELSIDLNEYALATGSLRGTLLGNYIRGRVGKACAFLVRTGPTSSSRRKAIRISYKARLVAPFCVFLR